MSSSLLPPVVQLTQPKWFPQTLYALVAIAYAAFGGIASYIAIKDPTATKDAETFITARKTQGVWTIMFAFYGIQIGAATILTPPQFSGGPVPAGWLGAVAYAFASGFPVLVIPCFGVIATQRYSNLNSWADFISRRFGPITWFLVTLLEILNMAATMLGEYTAISSIFATYVDPQGILPHGNVFVVVMVAWITALYTALGGVKVSIITDRFQGIASLFLLIFIVIYVAATFRYPLLQERYETGKLGKNNFSGQESWCSLTISLLGAACYSEALWQRVWAAKNSQTIILGGFGACCLVFIVNLFYAIGGVLSFWSGRPPFDAEGNLTFFTIFSESQRASWITVFVILMAAIMNESAVDSIQDGLLAVLYTFYKYIKESLQDLKDRKKQGNADTNHDKDAKAINTNDMSVMNVQVFRKTLWIRLLVIVINVILVPLSLQNYSLLAIFFVAQFFTTLFIVPQVLGIIINPKYYNETMQLICVALTFTSAHIYAIFAVKKLVKSQDIFTEYSTNNVFQYAWNETFNGYDYGLFLTPFITGVLAVSILVSCKFVYMKLSQKIKNNKLGKGEGNLKVYNNDLFSWTYVDK